MASKQNNNDEEQDQVTDQAEAPARDEDTGTPQAEQAEQAGQAGQARQAEGKRTKLLLLRLAVTMVSSVR
jgi:hypothetical protein